ncbi:MAG: hypothetical protein IH878_19055 [Gemmatimonadetes bacterium]|nr:hypothetical protein [Gemmatimonadota bacterium]
MTGRGRGDYVRWCRRFDGLGLGEYAEAFARHPIDAGVLPRPSDDDLKDIGVRGCRRSTQATGCDCRPNQRE